MSLLSGIMLSCKQCESIFMRAIVALKYDYGIRERGLSFEHYTFYDALVNMGHDVLYFDIGELHQKYGFEKMNRRLAEVVRAEARSHLLCIVSLFRSRHDARHFQ